MSEEYTIEYLEIDSGNEVFDENVRNMQKAMEPYIRYIIDELIELDEIN
ncbi:hypothetical protein LCGC14_1948100 [marine sediment metagenome]|uniref:Uncharacterized protein n=1 Tax=marine sediment metagenome TaxID=412755 RepID=A0A0F9FIJ5_9ZZZZ